jgi:hypothetical protein
MREERMTTGSASVPSTLVDEFVTRTGLSWLQVSIGFGLVLLLLLSAALYLDSIPALPASGNSWWSFWLAEADQPAIVVYILVNYHLLKRSHQNALQALRSLMSLDDDAFDRLVVQTSVLVRRREWVASGMGAACGLLLQGPWGMPDLYFWRRLFLFLSVTIVYGLLGWIIYVLLASSRQFAELHRRPLDIDVFDPTPLEPIARWSLGISLVFIGGITLSMLFNPTAEEFLSIEGILIYGTLILVSVVMFFLTMASTHRAMVEAKDEKLRLVRRNLSVTFQKLQERAAKSQLQDMEALSDSITAWLAYEKRFEEAPEWPYTTDTVRNLLMSTLLPVAAWGAQIIVELIT